MGNFNSKITVMRSFATLALIGAASAQDLLTKCNSTADCPGDKIADGGCCQEMKVLGTAEEPQWGAFKDNVFQGKDMKVGTAVQYCFNGAFVKFRAENEKDGKLDNVTDLTGFLESYPGADEVLKLDANPAEAWIEGWGSDLATHEAFFLGTTCIAGAAKIAASLGAAIAVYTQI